MNPSTAINTGVFSHINEYGYEHAAMLPELMAVSVPLTLWSPSAYLLETATRDKRRSGPGGEFITRLLIEAIAGEKVVVMARPQWFDERARADLAVRFPPAAWHPTFDRQLATWAEQGHPAVIVAPEEKGRLRAELYVKRAPNKADGIGRLVEEGLLDRSRSSVPDGTLDRAMRKSERRDKAVELLRDVYNHAQALRDSGAAIEYFQPRYGAFLQYLGAEIERSGKGRATEPRATASTLPRSEDQLVTPLMAVLDLLQRLRRDEKGKRMMEFLDSPGHLELAQWTQQVARELGSRDELSLRTTVARRLRQDIGDHEPEPAFGREDWLGVAGTVAAAGALVDPVLEAIGLVVAAVSGVRIVQRALLAMGRGTPDYSGPAWPFIYTAGSRPTARQIRNVWKTLDRIERGATR